MSKTRSLIALDWVNFFVADVEAGVGPFLSTYLSAVRHLNSAQIGTIIATQNFSSVLAQMPAGWIVDESRHKNWLIAVTSAVIAAGVFLVTRLTTVAGQVTNQVLVGLSVTLIAPSIAAISLGTVGRNGLGPRIGRNSGFNHAGNIVTAVLGGMLGRAAGQEWIFYSCAVLGLASSAVALLIRREDVDDIAARELRQEKDGMTEPLPWQELWTNRQILIFALTVILFHIANAAMLPLAGQELSRSVGKASAQYMSACIVLAQCVMIPVALVAGKLANKLGRKTIFLIGFGSLVARGLCFAASQQPVTLVAIEGLDGIGTGISGVLTVLVIADLAKDTGRFNLLQGGIRTALGLGAFVGNFTGGELAKWFGFSFTFAVLAAVAASGFLLYWLAMPETADLAGVRNAEATA